MFCCGKKESKKQKNEIHPNQENKFQEKQENQKIKTNINEEEIQNFTKVLENIQSLKEQIETIEQDCKNGNKQQMDIIVATVTQILNSPKKTNPETYGNAIILILKVFEKENEYLKEQIQGDILFRFSKIAKVANKFVQDGSDYEDEGVPLISYFSKSNFEQLSGDETYELRQKFEAVIEGILIWGLWFKDSKYEKTLKKSQESGVQFPKYLTNMSWIDGMEDKIKEFLKNSPNKEIQQEDSQEYQNKKDKKQEGDFFKNNKMQAKAVMLGIDGCGKTTLLYKLKTGEVISVTPTEGFNSETLELHKSEITLWEVGGSEKSRPNWKYFLGDTSILVFVIDATDSVRIDTCKEELKIITGNEEVKDCIFLIYANKCDMEGCLSNEEILEKYDLKNCLKDKQWNLQRCSAHSGEGLKDGMNWANKALLDNQENQKKKNK